VRLHAVLISALHGVERSTSRPDHFTTRESFSGSHWVGHRAGVDAVEKQKIQALSRVEPQSLGPSFDLCSAKTVFFVFIMWCA